MAQSNIIVKLSLKDQDVVRRGLEALGADGEKALRRIEAAGRTPGAGLKALGAASDELKGKMGGLAGSAGSVGSALQALGPGGLVAAAGIGAMVAGFAALMARTREAIDKLDDLGDSAARIGVSAEYLQEVRFALEQLGVPIESVDNALAAFNVNVGKVGLQGDEAAKKIRIAFEALRIPLDEVQRSDPTQLLQRVATELSKIKDTARQAAIAKALGIEEMLPALREGGDAINRLREDARRLGIVLDEDLVKNAGEAKNQLDAMQRVVDAQLTQALVNATPLVLAFAKGFAAVAEKAGLAVDRLNAVEERASHTLKAEIADLGRQIKLQEQNVEAAKAPRNMLERGLAGVGLNRPQELEVKQAEDSLRRLRRERDTRQAILDERQRQLDLNKTTAGGAGGVIDLDAGKEAARGAEREAKRKAEELKRLVEADEKLLADFERQVALFGDQRKLRVEETVERLSKVATPEQQDYLGFLADKLEELKEAREKDEKAERARQAVEEEGKRIYEQTRTPAEQYAGTLEHLRDLHAQSAINADTYARAVEQAGDAFSKSQEKTDETALKLTDTFQGFGQVTSSAFEDAIVKGEELSTVLNGLAEDIQRLLIRNALNKLFGVAEKEGGGWLDSLFGGTSSAGYGTTGAGGMSVSGGTNSGFLLGGVAHGAAFDRGNVIPFARGGVVHRPTLFSMARGIGLMGEAGPEAVLPLRRTASGDLGVAGGGSNVTVNVINNAGAKVTTAERKDENGNMSIDVMIDAVEQAMAQRMTRPGTTLNRAYRGAADPVRAR